MKLFLQRRWIILPEEFYISKSVVAFLLAQMIKNLPAVKETWVWSVGHGRSPGEGNGNSLQHLAWGIPGTEEPGGATIHGVTKSCTGLSNQHFHFPKCYKSADFLLLMPKIWSRPSHCAGWTPAKLWNSCINCLENQEVDLWLWLKVKVWEALERKLFQSGKWLRLQVIS